MGYTNYWQTKELTEEEIPAQFWDDAEKVLDKIIASGVKLAAGNGVFKFESGHEVINDTLMSDQKYPSICFNGLGEEAYETFVLVFDGDWNFCKTARLPYDLAVKCILMLATKYNLLANKNEDDISGEDYWSFDGNETEEEYIRAHDLLVGLELI